MQKSLIAAAIVGAASASLTQTWNIVSGNNYFTMFIKGETDAGYTTTYKGSDGTVHSESYGASIYSYANLTVGMEYFNSYKNQYMFSLIPLEVTPYTQTVNWMRPEAKNGQSVNAFGGRTLTLAKFTTTYTENVKTCGASFVDAAVAMDASTLAPTCAYDKNTETNYEDSYWKYEPLASNSWYGDAQFWTKNIFSKSA